MKDPYLEKLLDNRNNQLWEEVNGFFNCKIIVDDSIVEYGCYSKDNNVCFFIPSGNLNPESFTHELLHVFLRMKKVFIGGGLKLAIGESKELKSIYSEALLEHMGNCLDHVKMLPYYLELGFDRKKFLSDYEQDKCSYEEVELLEKYFKRNLIKNEKGIVLYIGKLFAIQGCPNETFNYESRLNALKNLDEELFRINTVVFDKWSNVDIENDDILADNYIDVLNDYVDAMKLWTQNRK